MKVLIQYFTKGEFGETIFSAPEKHVAGEDMLYIIVRKAVSKKVDGTCFCYIEDNALKQVYWKIWRDNWEGKIKMQRCTKVAGKSEVVSEAEETTITKFCAEVYDMYMLVPEDKREA